MHDNYQTSCIITPPHYQYGTLSIIINTQYHSTSLYLLFTSTTIIIRSLSFHPFYIFRFTFIFSTSFFTSTSIATHVPFFHRFSILSMRHQIFSGLRTSNLCKFFCIESIYSLVCPCDTKYFRVCGHRIYVKFFINILTLNLEINLKRKVKRLPMTLKLIVQADWNVKVHHISFLCEKSKKLCMCFAIVKNSHMCIIVQII